MILTEVLVNKFTWIKPYSQNFLKYILGLGKNQMTHSNYHTVSSKHPGALIFFQKSLKKIDIIYAKKVYIVWQTYTQQNSYSISHLLGTVTTLWSDSDCVVTVDNCRQSSDYNTANGSPVTALPAVVNGDYTVTVQSQCMPSDCA